jgi:hypothetical protein
MVRLRDRGMANGWRAKLADVLGDDENSLAAVRNWGKRYNLCGFSPQGDVEWVASGVPRLLEASMPAKSSRGHPRKRDSRAGPTDSGHKITGLIVVRHPRRG